MDPKTHFKYEVKPSRFHFEPVEFIIPFHNEHESVSRLISAIFSTVVGNRYLISLVDDGSRNAKYVHQINEAKIPGVRCLQFKKQRGFGAAVNFALAHPKHEWVRWVCILHSDTLPQDNLWLNNLGQYLMRAKAGGVKMVSPRTDNPTAFPDILYAKRGDEGEDVVLQEGQYLPMYCALAHRKLFKRVGLLKECPYAGTEVEEYAKRMRESGFQQAVCGSSWVHHDGGLTLAQYASDEKVQEILRKTRDEFLAPPKTEQKEAASGVDTEVKDAPLKEDSHEMQKY
jgi:GT2 family glycosyltransferase